jgi:hypothetical protein
MPFYSRRTRYSNDPLADDNARKNNFARERGLPSPRCVATESVEPTCFRLSASCSRQPSQKHVGKKWSKKSFLNHCPCPIWPFRNSLCRSNLRRQKPHGGWPNFPARNRAPIGLHSCLQVNKMNVRSEPSDPLMKHPTATKLFNGEPSSQRLKSGPNELPFEAKPIPTTRKSSRQGKRPPREPTWTASRLPEACIYYLW